MFINIKIITGPYTRIYNGTLLVQALEERLIQKHADELRAEFTANRTLIDLTKAEAEKALALALETQAAKLLSEKRKSVTRVSY